MPSRGTKKQYAVRFWVGDVCFDADWRWPNRDTAKWMLSEKDGSCWYHSGALSEEGRMALLKHFKLEERELEFPMETLVSICPRDLERECRKSPLVRQTNESRQSDRIGAHVPANMVI